MDVQSVSTADATLTLELQPRANLKSKFGKFFPREFLFFTWQGCFPLFCKAFALLCTSNGLKKIPN